MMDSSTFDYIHIRLKCGSFLETLFLFFFQFGVTLADIQATCNGQLDLSRGVKGSRCMKTPPENSYICPRSWWLHADIFETLTDASDTCNRFFLNAACFIDRGKHTTVTNISK